MGKEGRREKGERGDERITRVCSEHSRSFRFRMVASNALTLPGDAYMNQKMYHTLAQTQYIAMFLEIYKYLDNIVNKSL